MALPIESATLCERCGQRRAVVHVGRVGTVRTAVCVPCLHLLPELHTARSHGDAARFFVHLARPVEPAPALEMARMPPDAECAACGLSYREFCRTGLAGCPSCYSAFAPAVASALGLLQQAHGTL